MNDRQRAAIARSTHENNRLKEQLAAQAARIKELEAFVSAFMDNFETCSTCFNEDTDDACDSCGGTGIQMQSRGILLSELFPDARRLLAETEKR